MTHEEQLEPKEVRRQRAINVDVSFHHLDQQTGKETCPRLGVVMLKLYYLLGSLELLCCSWKKKLTSLHLGFLCKLQISPYVKIYFVLTSQPLGCKE